MKVTFYSNYMNHHQLAVSKKFIEKGIDYTFVATTSISKERLSLGYQDMNKQYDFVLTTYDSNENYKRALELALESDIVIIGSASDEFIQERLKQNKIIFRYSERIFKQGRFTLKSIKNIISYRIRNLRNKERNTYLLSASAYASKDYLLLGKYKNKCYKWGYFPEFIEYNIDELINNKDKEITKIIWVGRFIDWKHPEYAVYLAEYLISKNIDKFEIVMIGNGQLLEDIKFIVKRKKLERYIKILGAVPSTEVRKYMEEANIHIFTSDRSEGWGAVLNESMNSACAVVANRDIGSVPYLIDNGKSGLWYKNKKEFLQNVEFLIVNKNKCIEISKQAYKSIKEIWNADNAASNLLKLFESITTKSFNNIKEGPCSKDIEYL